MSVFLAVEFAYGTIGEKLALCGRMILTGMGTVFLVLCILWAVIAIFGAVAKAQAKRERERIMEQVKNSPAPNDAKRSVPETAPASTDEIEEDDGALIAVITAAIEAFRAAEGAAPGSYRVVSFKRKNTRKSWNGPIDD
ncbi:MAG: OadG family protein [Clostridia bacterium]|nr:OadG family protein [Clostridia bacterium]